MPHSATHLPISNFVLADYKREMVYNRLVCRLRTLNIDDFDRYLALLESDANSAECQAFINALTTNLTAFFRKVHHFSPFWRNMRLSVPAASTSGARRPRPARSINLLP